MGRKSLLKSTKKKPAQSKKEAEQDAKKKQAILEGIHVAPGSIKAVLEKIGLAQSTYYRWSKKYKAEGIDGLKTGGVVSDKVWKNFSNLQKQHEAKLTEKDTKLKVEEKQAMKSDKNSEKVRELLFKKFDEKGGEKIGGQKAVSATGDSTGGDSASSCGTTSPPAEPMDKTVKYALGGFAVLLAILLMSSFSNTTNFYFAKVKDGIELRQGRFAPMGERQVAVITGSDIAKQLPDQDSYSRKQAYGVLFSYLLKKADNVLNSSRMPDLKAVRSYLTEAMKYTVSSAERKAVRTRLNSIDFLVISGKADLALNKGTTAGFQAAKSYLTEAIPYATTDIQKEIITKRLAAIEYAMATQKISKGEKQLAKLYRQALDLHLRRAKQYDPEKSQEIDAEVTKIRKWLEEFDKRHVGKPR